MRLKSTDIMQVGDIAHYKRGALSPTMIIKGFAGHKVNELLTYGSFLNYVERPWNSRSLLCQLYLLFALVGLIAIAFSIYHLWFLGR